MEKASKRNIVLTVIVAILILVTGVSFAYFLAQTLINGEGSTSKVTTAVIKDTTFTVTGELEFNDEGIYPGHKNVSKIKVVAKENAGVTIDYNLIWNGRNGLATPINYYVYKTTSNENPSITCEVQKGMKSGYEIIYEECTNNNFNNLGEIISSGTITTSDDTRKIVLKENESTISSEEGTTVYYYVVLEYPNLDTAQNRDSEHTFQGEVTVELYERTTCGTHNVTTVLGVLEVNDCKPDFNYSFLETSTPVVVDAKSKITNLTNITNDATYPFNYDSATGTFTSTNKENDTTSTLLFSPSTSVNNVAACYKVESEKEYDQATFYLDDTEIGTASGFEENCIDIGNITSSNVIKVEYAKDESGGDGQDEIIFYLSNNYELISEEIPGKTGIYEAEDEMYSGMSYYYRGAAENNYLKFADYCWRIVRINGDGSIRLIYDGTTCHANGTSTAESIAVANKVYNTSDDRSEYVGYTYVEGKQRPDAGDTSIESNLKIETDKWYQENIVSKGLDNKVAISKYCNDREVEEGTTWQSQPIETFNYLPYKRIRQDYKPALKCSNETDIYNLKVGAITADEAMMAGFSENYQANTSYYLCNGQYYWTISSFHVAYNSSVSNRWTLVFAINDSGYLGSYSVDWTTPGIRPVLSLNPNSLIITGSGTISDPYIAS